MPNISLKEALRQIKNTFTNKHRFFFIVGAGVSAPEVKLAAAITDDCRKLAKEIGCADEPNDKDLLDEYSFWFQRAFIHLEERQQYIRSLITGKNISQANFLLAQILIQNKITKLVITPNFDDFLAKTLRFFGEEPIVCDDPKTTLRIDPSDFQALQIIHVHGTFWFYDVCNLRGEIEIRAKSAMSSLLESILINRSPLIVGYSGWEHDVIMTALKNRLYHDRIPNNLYWFCYRSDDLKKFPNWLQEHPDVNFVLPNVFFDNDGNKEKDALRPASDGYEILSAESIFQGLVDEVRIEQPSLILDPLSFFAKQLKKLLPRDYSKKGQTAYRLGDVIQRVETGNQLLKTHEAVIKQEKNSLKAKLEAIKEVFRKGDNKNSIRLICELTDKEWEFVEAESAKELSSILKATLPTFKPRTKNEIARYENVINVLQRLSKQSEKYDEIIAETLFDWAYSSGEKGDLIKEIEIYDRLIAQFLNSKKIQLQIIAAKAFYNKGFRLINMEKYWEAIEVYDEFDKKFRKIKVVGNLSTLKIMSLINKGIACGKLKDFEEEVKVLVEVDKRYRNTEEVQQWVATALVNKGIALIKMNKASQAINIWKETRRRFGKHKDPQIQERVSKATGNHSFALICKAKKSILKSSTDVFKPTLREALKKAEEAICMNQKNSNAWQNASYAHFLLGEEEKARESLRQAILIGGDKIKRAALNDTENLTIPEDKGYGRLVESLFADMKKNNEYQSSKQKGR
jgi:tetratricopeptide (TPR) repeat protein